MTPGQAWHRTSGVWVNIRNDHQQPPRTMTFALVASSLHLLRHPRVIQVTQTSRLLRERLLRQCHARPTPAIDDRSRHHQQSLSSTSAPSPIPLTIPLHSSSPSSVHYESRNGVTLIQTTQQACIAMKALVELSEQGRPIAWTLHKGEDSYVLNGFAGDDVNFGNGPNLLFHVSNSHEHNLEYLQQLERYFEQNSDKLFIWHDYGTSMKMFSRIGIEPKGFHRDIQSMIKFLPRHSSTSDLSLEYIADSILPSPNTGEDRENQSRLIYSIHEELCKQLKDTQLCPFTIPAEYNQDIKTGLDTYDHFFRLVNDSLYKIEQNGMFVSDERLKALHSDLNKEKTSSEQFFLEWASKMVGPNSKYIDPHKSAHLRQLLFAPCTNRKDSSLSIAHEEKLKVLMPPDVYERYQLSLSSENGGDSSKQKKKKGRKRTRPVKAEIDVKGMGMTPFNWLKNGWPSTSKSSLLRLVQLEQENEGFRAALDKLMESGEIKNKSTKLEKLIARMDKHQKATATRRLHFKHKYDIEDIGIISKEKPADEISFTKDIRRALDGEEDNDIVEVGYKHLRLWALGELSGCNDLLNRIGSRSGEEVDIVDECAWRMYEGISDMIANGEIILNKDVQDGSIAHGNIKDKLPLTYDLVRKVDAAFRQGGGVGGHRHIAAITKTRGKKSEELRQRWYQAHPKVEEFHEQWRDRTLESGAVSTLMGRMRAVQMGSGGLSARQRQTQTEKGLQAAMEWVLAGTATEAVMASVTRMSMNEQLRGLGWRVVLVHGHEIVLEGPRFARDTALELIQGDAARPFPMLDYCLNVSTA